MRIGDDDANDKHMLIDFSGSFEDNFFLIVSRTESV